MTSLDSETGAGHVLTHDLSIESFRRCVAEAAKAPSAHNTQPVRWRLTPSGRVEVHELRARQLRASDPTGQDQLVAVGAAIEGFSLALGELGLGLHDLRLEAPQCPAEDAQRLAASFGVAEGGVADALVAAVDRRQSCRSLFAEASPDALAALQARCDADANLRLICDPSSVAFMAALGDPANLATFEDPAVYDELWQWLRLSPRHPDYARDGLNAEALSVHGLERWAGQWAMRPGLYRVLHRLGLASALVSERAQTQSASGMLLLYTTKDAHPIELGRWFYRSWLMLTDCGFAACPMSVLAEHEEALAALSERFPARAEQRLINVFRVGPLGAPYGRARLPVGDLILAD